ncbi:MAG: radical SAM protein, partial [Desulfobacterales bacterium]|nr:radical SAM protein [Desulfobacterales bacterium]
MTNDQLPPIKGFIETSLLDWPGQICAVIFLPYCNLRCPYCHNHQLVLQPDALETLTIQAILERLRPLKDWIHGSCITGGEPTIHRRLPAVLETIHEAGFKTKLDTNGTQPEVLHYLTA